MSERLPRVVLGVRKATSPDEEFKIIVFSPSFVLNYINEVLRLVSLGRLKYVHTGTVRPYPARGTQILWGPSPHPTSTIVLEHQRCPEDSLEAALH